MIGLRGLKKQWRKYCGKFFGRHLIVSRIGGYFTKMVSQEGECCSMIVGQVGDDISEIGDDGLMKVDRIENGHRILRGDLQEPIMSFEW